MIISRQTNGLGETRPLLLRQSKSISEFYEIADEDYTMRQHKSIFWIGVIGASFFFALMALFLIIGTENPLTVFFGFAAFGSLGSALAIYAKWWKVTVKKDSFTVYEPLRQPREYQLSEISKVRETLQGDKDTVFSAFLYDFSREYIVHFRRLFTGARSDNEYQNLLSVQPRFKDEIAKMILLDFITRQDDRHLSNIAIKISDEGESFYPLYDNGRSLFYEDTEEMVRAAVNDPAGYATTFGYSGTYWDYVQEIAAEQRNHADLINLKIFEADVAAILHEAGFAGYRYNGALNWIIRAMEMISSL